VAVRDPAGMLERPLDEERRVGDVLDRPRRGQVAVRAAVQEALALSAVTTISTRS
jgi:hypothetical protein